MSYKTRAFQKREVPGHPPCGVPFAPGALAGTALSPLASLAGSPLAARETTATSPTGKTGPTVRRHKAYPDVADRRAQMNDQPQVALRRGARRPALPLTGAVENFDGLYRRARMSAIGLGIRGLAQYKVYGSI